MTSMLVINASPNPEGSNSRALTDHFVETWKANNGVTDVVTRDVGLTPPPHITQDYINAIYTPVDSRSEEQNTLLTLSDDIVDEAEAADVIVIGSPMHNFTVSSQLKSWIDHLARVGRTFNYTEDGPVGALGGRKVFVLTARGGRYSNGAPAAAMDHQEPFLRTVLGFVGLDDVTFIHGEGVASGSEGLDFAKQQVSALFPAHAA